MEKLISENPLLKKEIILEPHNLKRFSLENFDEYINMQVDGIYQNYEAMIIFKSTWIKDKLRLIGQLNDKIDNADISNSNTQIQAQRKEIDNVKKGIENKKTEINQKILKIKEKLDKIQFSDKDVLTRFQQLKGFFNDHKRKYIDLNKSFQETKEDLFDAINSSILKIVHENLNPKIISKDLLRKQEAFENNLKNLESKLSEEAEKLLPNSKTK